MFRTLARATLRSVKPAPYIEHAIVRNVSNVAGKPLRNFKTNFLLGTALFSFAAGAGYYASQSKVKVSCEAQTEASQYMKKVEEMEKNKRYEVLLPSDAKPTSMSQRMDHYVKKLQYEIVSTLAAIDGKDFVISQYQRPGGGEGAVCVLQGGNVFEKAGVNVSVMSNKLPKAAVKQMREKPMELHGDGPYPFFVASISLVLHPHNPMVPTVHLNYRYFEIQDEDGKPQAWWFGGGSDLTPSYLFEEDAVHFHSTLKQACQNHDPEFYPEFKKWCDRYFYLPHRSEARGIGGIFFDDLDTHHPEQIFQFIQECGDAFLPSYVPIVLKRKDHSFTEQEKEWQQIRRGRYVEFNLVHDRGTKFGLRGPGPKIENILMSLPLTARWEYCHSPEVGSEEEKLLEVINQPRDWVPLN
ncbi:Coproporphyrinogen-III oxidase [Basidiobolus ranarum]|uniref:coproporphyrinogen oxidase n=1 Tax=Basidiobolus ranarum TaxID=34480 RepID=A0ABR2W5L5_9FUNG